MAYVTNQPLGPVHTQVTVSTPVQTLGDQVPKIITKDSTITEATNVQYNSLDDVQNDYSTDSAVYAMANAIFNGTNPPEAIIVLTCVDSDSYVSPQSITLDNATLSGTVGSTLKITPTVLPATATDKTVTAVSGDTSVATISPNSDGSFSVALKATGHATLTFKTGTSNEITVTASVSAAAAIVAATGVTLNKTTLSGPVNGSGTLTATVKPTTATNSSVTWASSDETVATVDANGKVSYLKAGTTTITVTTVDGSFTATAAVTVSAGS